MRFRQSVKYRLMIGFVLVMIPIIAYMLFNNSISRELVKTKVSETYSNTLSIFSGQIDHYLMQIDDYLYKMAVLDPDIGLLSSYPVNSNEYTLTKVRIDAKLNRDVGVYNLLNSVFLFQPNDIIFGTESLYGETHKLINAHMLADKDRQDEMLLYGKTNWYIGESERIDGKYFLINYIKINDSIYFGAIVTIKAIHELLLIQWNDGEIGYSDIYLTEENGLTAALTGLEGLEQDSTSSIIESNEREFVIMDQFSDVTNVAYRLAIPEKTIMKELLFFRNATLVAPIFS